MASELPEELRRLHHAVTRLSAKVGDMSKKLEESSTSLGRMTEERDRLNAAYNAEKRKMKKTKNDNERLMRALEIQRKEIEQQAKEIEKRDAQLDFKSKQLLVLRELNNATQVSRKLNTVKVKPKGVTNESSWDKVQVQIDTNAMHKELEEKDSGLDNELNRKQTLADKEHRSNHDLQEARKVSIEEAKKEDDEKLIELIDEWGKGDTEGNGGLECNAFQDMFPPIPPPEFLVDMCKDMPNNSSGLSSELPVPDDDIAGLEWLPTFVENSLLAGGIPLDIDFPNNNKKDDSLENSSSRSGRKTIPFSPDTVVPERARSKRPRSTAAIFNQQPALNLVSPKSSITNVQNLPMPNSYISSKSKYFAESHPPQTPKSDGKEQKKKMKKRLPPSLPSYSSDHDNLLQQQQQPGVPVKTCSHCEITETPVWRAGPMGPRTLCNACGMRYRSGRLLPEYRPAASPTFVASIHSNSHRKIVEMMKVKSTPDR